MEWLIKTFSQLTAEELYQILQLRVDVFVVEQNCPYHELDGKDQQALHVFARDQEGIQAYLRVLAPGVSSQRHPWDGSSAKSAARDWVPSC